MIRTNRRDNPATSLTIFNSFQVDWNLPKFRKRESSKQATGDSDSEPDYAVVGNPVNFSFSSENGEMEMSEGTVPLRPRVRRAHDWLKKLMPRLRKGVTVDTVFTLVLGNAQELQAYQDRQAAFDKMVENARQAGQRELVERLQQEKQLRQYENVLFAKGWKRFLTEEQLLRFAKDCQRGLCLDWVSQYIRPIPEDVIARKLEADREGLFDNYVVLHYDPENKNVVQRPRDPILFGVMRGSRRLYFVGDWVDEHCDLTLQQIAEKLGEKLEMEP